MEPDLVERTVRDFLTEDVDRVLIDNKADYDRTQDLVGLISKRSRSKIAFYTGQHPDLRALQHRAPDRADRPAQGPAAERRRDRDRRDRGPDRDRRQHRLAQEPLRATRRTPSTPSTSRRRRRSARQIRLRNLGGLIILDFIDMKERRHRNAVYEKMVELMSSDKAKNHILPISQLGHHADDPPAPAGVALVQPLHRLPVLPRPRHREVRHDHVGRAPAPPLLGRSPPPGPQGRQGVFAPRPRASRPSSSACAARTPTCSSGWRRASGCSWPSAPTRTTTSRTSRSSTPRPARNTADPW